MEERMEEQYILVEVIGTRVIHDCPETKREETIQLEHYANAPNKLVGYCRKCKTKFISYRG